MGSDPVLFVLSARAQVATPGVCGVAVLQVGSRAVTCQFNVPLDVALPGHREHPGIKYSA